MTAERDPSFVDINVLVYAFDKGSSTPSDLSMKNTVPSGGFATDRFDRTDLQMEVLRKFCD